MKDFDWFPFIIKVYLFVALITFGYATNADWETEKPALLSERMVPVDDSQNVLRGLVCGLTWPLYLAYKSFKGVRP